MSVRLIVDPDVCIGSGECIAEDPAAIELDDSGCARVLIAELEEDRAQRICDVCPVGALSIQH
jgi:ferredoxin